MNLSNRNLMRDDLSKGVSLWDLPIVSEGETATIIPGAEESILLPTAEDIENIQKQAYQEAYDEAFKKAKLAGFDEGKVLGEKEGHAEGFEKGRQEGYDAANIEKKDELDEKSRIFSSLASNLAAPLDKLDNVIEDELVTLAMQVARHLIRRELKQDPSHVIAAIRQAIKILPVSTQNVVLFLHPEDSVLVRESLSLGDENELRWKIIDDPMITRGGCKVETSNSRIDASVESQMNSVIAQVLGGERGNDRGKPTSES